MNKQLRMDPEVKARWVKALRSGEYVQVQDRLRKGSKHCCLGVLCDLYTKESGKRWGFSGMKWRDIFDFADLPGPEVCIWAGLPDENPVVRIGKAKRALSGHNDNGAPFAEIADAIEEQL